MLIVILHDKEPGIIEELKETRKTLENLLALLQSGEHERFAAHLYQSRREFRRTCETAGKSGKQIERCIISTFSDCRKHWASRANFASGKTSYALEIRPETKFR